MEGHSLGAVAINTVTSAGLVLIAVALSLVVLGTDVSTATLLLIAAPIGVVFPILFDPISYFWNAIELLMRPVADEELDPRFHAGSSE